MKQLPPISTLFPYTTLFRSHGPIIFEGDGKRYALRWTAFDPAKNNAEFTQALSRARNWKEFNEALESFTAPTQNRSEEHTSELQSQSNLVCRLLLEKKKTFT